MLNIDADLEKLKVEFIKEHPECIHGQGFCSTCGYNKPTISSRIYNRLCAHDTILTDYEILVLKLNYPALYDYAIRHDQIKSFRNK